MMKSKGKTISSLLGNEVAHSSTIDEDADWGVVEGAFEGQGVSAEDFIDAADLESCSRRVSVILILGLGFHGEGLMYRALVLDL